MFTSTVYTKLFVKNGLDGEDVLSVTYNFSSQAIGNFTKNFNNIGSKNIVPNIYKSSCPVRKSDCTLYVLGINWTKLDFGGKEIKNKIYTDIASNVYWAGQVEMYPMIFASSCGRLEGEIGPDWYSALTCSVSFKGR